MTPPGGGGGDYNRSWCDPPPSYLSKLGGGGGPLEGVCVGGGGGGGYWRFGLGGGRGVPKVGGLLANHYCHMHTSRGDVCLGGLGAWRYLCDNSAFSS